MREIGHHTALQKASGSQQGATIKPAARRLWQMSCIIQKALYSCQLSAEMGYQLAHPGGAPQGCCRC